MVFLSPLGMLKDEGSGHCRSRLKHILFIVSGDSGENRPNRDSVSFEVNVTLGPAY